MTDDIGLAQPDEVTVSTTFPHRPCSAVGCRARPRWLARFYVYGSTLMSIVACREHLSIIDDIPKWHSVAVSRFDEGEPPAEWPIAS
jgi:hypothetical protein